MMMIMMTMAVAPIDTHSEREQVVAAAGWNSHRPIDGWARFGFVNKVSQFLLQYLMPSF